MHEPESPNILSACQITMVTINKYYLYLTSLELSDILQSVFRSVMPFNPQINIPSHEESVISPFHG